MAAQVARSLRRIDDRQPLEIGSIEPGISRKQSVSLLNRVRPYQEISGYSFLRAARFSVLPPARAREERRPRAKTST